MKNFSLEPFDEETKILLQHVNDNFLIDKVEKVEFMSLIVGHEINTYDIKKLYIAKKILFSSTTIFSSLSLIRFYDNNNILKFEVTNAGVFWNNLVNASYFPPNLLNLSNILFSRILPNAYLNFKMIGYRITLK